MLDLTTTVTLVALVVQVIVLRVMDRLVRVWGAYTVAYIKAYDTRHADHVAKQQLVKAVEYFEELSRKETAA